MKIISDNLFCSSMQSKLDSAETPLIIAMTVCAFIGTILLLIFLGYGMGGGNFISLSIALVVIFIVLTIIILVLIVSLLMKKKTTVLKTSLEVTNVYVEPVLSKIPFPLYFDPLPKDTSSDKNGEKSSDTSSKKDEGASGDTTSPPSVSKKTGFLGKVGKFLKDLAPPDEPSYAARLIKYREQMYGVPTEKPLSKHSKKLKKLADKSDKRSLLDKVFSGISLEEVCTIDVNMLEEPVNPELLGELTTHLRDWLKSKIGNYACTHIYSPEADGNCLLGAFLMGMEKIGRDVPSREQLRMDATVFIKSEFMKNDLLLILLLNDFLECMGSFETSFEEDKRKKEELCAKVSVEVAKLSERSIHLNMEGLNNVTAALTTSSKKEFSGCSFLVDFINVHANFGVFCGPAMIYALARLYNVSVFLYTKPPLTETQLAFEGDTNEECFLCTTKEKDMGCTGSLWKKNIMVFNAEANSDKPICLGLLVNHFVFLDMQEKI